MTVLGEGRGRTSVQPLYFSKNHIHVGKAPIHTKHNKNNLKTTNNNKNHAGFFQWKYYRNSNTISAAQLNSGQFLSPKDPMSTPCSLVGRQGSQTSTELGLMDYLL